MTSLIADVVYVAEDAHSYEWPTILLGVGTLLISVVAVTYAIREHRNSRENIIREMRMEWSQLQPSWARILMAEHGSDFHYVDASTEERKKANAVYRDLRNSMIDPDERGYIAARDLRKDVRSVTRFLNYAADSVLRGRWLMSEAYEVFGPDVARQLSGCLHVVETIYRIGSNSHWNLTHSTNMIVSFFSLFSYARNNAEEARHMLIFRSTLLRK